MQFRDADQPPRPSIFSPAKHYHLRSRQIDRTVAGGEFGAAAYAGQCAADWVGYLVLMGSLRPRVSTTRACVRRKPSLPNRRSYLQRCRCPMARLLRLLLVVA